MPVIAPQIPSNIRAYLSTLLGDRTPITNGSLSPTDITALKAAAHKAVASGKPLDYTQYPLDSFNALDRAGWLEAIKRSFSDPNYRLETTIGAANLKRDKAGNLHVVDTYDFNNDGPGKMLLDQIRQGNIKGVLKASGDRPTEVLDALGYLFAPETAKKRRPIDINLGPIGQLLKKR